MIIALLTHALCFILGAICCAVYVWPMTKRKPAPPVLFKDGGVVHLSDWRKLDLPAAKRRQKIEACLSACHPRSES